MDNTTNTTADTITDAQINQLHDEASAAGDLDMRGICERALRGHPAAVQAAVDAINSAAAMLDD